MSTVKNMSRIHCLQYVSTHYPSSSFIILHHPSSSFIILHHHSTTIKTTSKTTSKTPLPHLFVDEFRNNCFGPTGLPRPPRPPGISREKPSRFPAVFPRVIPRISRLIPGGRGGSNRKSRVVSGEGPLRGFHHATFARGRGQFLY